MKHFKFNGINQEENYFEGWYLKLIDEKKNYSYALIFGMTLYENDPHAFIEIIDDKKNKSQYIRFDINEFHYNDEMIIIGNNVLSPYILKLEIPGLSINIEMDGHEVLKNDLLNPSTMGYFKYLPMCTSHEIIYTNAFFHGELKTRWKTQKITGNAYLEKNWGSKFPKKWMWVEANTFEDSTATFTTAIVDIYNLKQKFFFAILKINGDEYRFANYNFARAEIVNANNKRANIVFYNDNLELYVSVKKRSCNTIVAPVKNGQMNRRIKHSINSIVKITLYKDNKIIFTDKCYDTGYENIY